MPEAEATDYGARARAIVARRKEQRAREHRRPNWLREHEERQDRDGVQAER